MKAVEVSYGSDPPGLICGYAFDPDHAARPIDSDTALDWLQGAGESGIRLAALQPGQQQPGLLGMNVGGVPLAQDPSGFWVIVAIIATFTAIAGWFAFLRQRD